MKIKDLLDHHLALQPRERHSLEWYWKTENVFEFEGDIMNVEEYDKTVEICVSYVS